MYNIFPQECFQTFFFDKDLNIYDIYLGELLHQVASAVISKQHICPPPTQCTMGKLQWEVGHRNFSLLREKYIWNIWTRIKWEAKLTNLSELFERC